MQLEKMQVFQENMQSLDLENSTLYFIFFCSLPMSDEHTRRFRSFLKQWRPRTKRVTATVQNKGTCWSYAGRQLLRGVLEEQSCAPTTRGERPGKQAHTRRARKSSEGLGHGKRL